MTVIGCGGAGKTTLARALGERLDLPVVHADFVVYRDGDVPRSEAEWQAELDRIADGDAWVIDAMKVSTLEHRVARADTVVFLDLPRRACYAGVLRRRLRYRRRIDRSVGIVDRITWEFLQWIWRFRRDARPRVLEVLARHADDTEVVVLRSRRAARRFLREQQRPASRDSRRCVTSASAVTHVPGTSLNAVTNSESRPRDVPGTRVPRAVMARCERILSSRPGTSRNRRRRFL